MTEQLQFAATIPLDERAQQVRHIIEARLGAAAAIRGDKILQRVGLPVTDNTRRWLKGVVEDLVLLHGVRIGACRGGHGQPPGYFLIVTQTDLDTAIHPLRKEVRALLRRLRALTSKHDVARLFGQAMLDFEKTPQRHGDTEAA